LAAKHSDENIINNNIDFKPFIFQRPKINFAASYHSKP
jgi:hypothetical protein